jgi:hypothetical protein
MRRMRASRDVVRRGGAASPFEPAIRGEKLGFSQFNPSNKKSMRWTSRDKKKNRGRG